MTVFVIHDDASESGGANAFRRDFSRILGTLGIDVFLFTYHAEEEGNPAHQFRYRFNDRIKFLRHIGRNYFNPLLFLSLKRLIGRIDPDLIHIHLNDTFTSTVLLACIGRIPVVQTVHDHRIVCSTGKGITPDGQACGRHFGTTCYRSSCLSLSGYLRRLLPGALNRFLMRRAVDAFLVPSNDLRERMLDYGLNASLLRHYVDLSAFSPVAPYPEQARLLFAGRMNEGKGVDVLLDAFKTVREQIPDAVLDLAGEEKNGQPYGRLARDLGVRNSVVFHGPIPHERMPELYAQAGIVVLPARWVENSPLVVLEAMASGRPVVAGRIGGIPELVVDGQTGLLCTPGDPVDLGNKLLILMKDKERATEMGRKGRERVEKHFRLDDHMKGYFDILGKIPGKTAPKIGKTPST